MDISNSAPFLSLQTADTVGTGKPSKLHEAAQQFEALMLGEIMRSVRESGSEGWLGSGDDAASGSAMDMAEGQFAKALSMGGGLGLTKMIEQSVGAERSEHQSVTAVPETIGS